MGFVFFVQAQNVNPEWAASMGGSNADHAYDVILDGSGNCYVTGNFMGTADFDPAAANLDLVSNGSFDVFIAKLSASGALLWAESFGGSSYERSVKMIQGPSGNLYICGEFSRTVDFDPGPGTFEMSSTGSRDIFIVKLDSSGSFIWAKSFQGDFYCGPGGMDIDARGNLYLTGYFSNSCNFDPDGGAAPIQSNGREDAFVVKMNSSGTLIWVRTFGGAKYEMGNAVKVDLAGFVYVGGYFEESVDFDPGSSVLELTSNGNRDAFILKLDNAGAFVGAQSMGDQEDDIIYAMDVDAGGNLIVAGSFRLSPDLDPGTGVTQVNSEGLQDIFVEKFTSSGALLWVKRFGSTSTDEAYSVRVGPAGMIYFSGYFQGSQDFDPGSGEHILYSQGFTDAFVTKLSGNGDFVWAASVGGNSSDYAYGIDVNEAGEVSICGDYENQAYFDPDISGFQMMSNGQSDAFMEKLEQVPTGLDSKDFSENHLQVFPNPGTGSFEINIRGASKKKLRVFNSNGKLVFEDAGLLAGTPSYSLDLRPGLYLIELSVGAVRQSIKYIVY